MADFDGTDDIFDSREVIDRIDELETEYTRDNEDGSVTVGFTDDAQGEADREEYEALVALRDEAEGYIADWKYGEAFISDDYFEDFARELAQDLGHVISATEWPLTHVDWEAAAGELQQDYTGFEFRGTIYWAR